MKGITSEASCGPVHVTNVEGQCLVQDDLSSLDVFHFVVRGHVVLP